MGYMDKHGAPERKYHAPEKGLIVTDGLVIEGYASLFGKRDQGGDVVQKGAYATSLKALAKAERRVKMLWQHDPAQPIGIWDEVREDGVGLYVKGRILPEVDKGREAAALLAAGAIDGLSIGYRTLRAEKDGKGQRLLSELELWEVSLVTFPMLPEARVAAKNDELADTWRGVAQIFEDARRELAAR
ncbi:HK97 family phage prohead protease [Pseudorhodobacter turbinis]|uniref:HK97 family phage prohead protease n=1 Tax=Pseudorhodobacter turbinis TaxID=2500533 RepID=A0A4P8ECL1_9RHOB|nr:HK97 family phage prohead protease [Pseudorhodobacter turbinis]QCO54601.1 HK97 family phage prohead protease [Pseudorhodobacter turbinis]